MINHEILLLCTIYPAGRSAVTKCRLPFLQFKGEIIYSNTRVDAENYAEQLMRQVEALKSSANDVSVALGFDTEWKVIFKRGGILCHNISFLLF